MRKVATLGWGIGALCDLACAIICLGNGKLTSTAIYLGTAAAAGVLSGISHFKETHWL